MGSVLFTPFDPARATEAEYRAGYDLLMANHAAEWSEIQPPTSFESYTARLRVMGEGAEPEISLEENTHLATVEVIVHPDRRREGIGTEFLKVMLAEARAAGRSSVLGPFVRYGHAGESWTSRLGFKPGPSSLLQQLDLASVDRSLWQVPTPAGYHLVAWSGPAPEDIVAAYARARQAMKDSVTDGLSWEAPDWTPERVRMEEEHVLAESAEQHAVVAVHDTSGEVVAVTLMYIRKSQPAKGFQMDTAVVREHRGHGLGRVVKAAMLRRLAIERPELEAIATQTADAVNMARINREVGYRDLFSQAYVEARISDIEAAMVRNAQRG
ncbi:MULTISPECIES: GNAT family N-acetyltransferase [Streptacidiphilus]|uniref:GNAT family N-acetyltransferase n=1 Tax=Streptacidiphilus cavernicola TaxID=3342716 RepID=A0ABV6UNP8_9ACTN|nr:GNAT family N-acetyltransferase [Streptacidiphilus jeojiense]